MSKGMPDNGTPTDFATILIDPAAGIRKYRKLYASCLFPLN